MYKVLEAIEWLWQLPQNVLGLVISTLFCYEISPGVYGWNNSGNTGSVCLGSYIFLGSGRTPKTYPHECGHQVQSRILGPLYLLVIGIPSICWAGIWSNRNALRFFTERGVHYYDFYTERWADRISGIHREYINKNE